VPISSAAPRPGGRTSPGWGCDASRIIDPTAHIDTVFLFETEAAHRDRAVARELTDFVWAASCRAPAREAGLKVCSYVPKKGPAV
jgi:hypothetical protein